MDNKITLQRAGVALAFPLAYAYVRLICYGWDMPWKTAVAATVFSLLFIAVSEIVRRGHKGVSAQFTVESTSRASEQTSSESTAPVETITAAPEPAQTPRELIFWYIMMIAVSITAPFGPNLIISMFGLHLCAVYSVILGNGLLLGGKTSGFIICDLIHGFYVKSFAGFPNYIIDWKSFFSGSKRKSFGWVIVLGFVILMGILLVISISCMSAIDADIARFINDITEYITNLFSSFDEIITRLIFAIPVCFYIYGLMSRSAKSDGSRERLFAGWLGRLLDRSRKVPAVVADVCAGVFVAAYILFFIKRIAYFTGGFAGVVPDGMLVSHYARNGFFELVGIMAVNACVYLVIILFERKSATGKLSVAGRVLVTLLMSESIAFAGIAFSKLWLYFSIFGYTPKRMLALWGTMALGFAAALAIATVFRRKSHFRIGVIFTAVTFVGVCIVSWVLGSMSSVV